MSSDEKRKPVVLGHGVLEFDGCCLMLEPDRLRLHCDRLVRLTAQSLSGTLLWLPDPPKPSLAKRRKQRTRRPHYVASVEKARILRLWSDGYER